MSRFRPARDSDIPALAELWSHAFPGSRSVEDRIRELEAGGRHGGIETAWLAEEGGRPVAAFKLFAMTQYITGVPLPMAGLAAVAVAPAHRRRGLGRALCIEAMRVGRERGDAISSLYPFRPAFYDALGWGSIGELHACTFRTAALRAGASYSAVRLATMNDVEAIAACYERVASRSNGPIRRDERFWRFRLFGAESGVKPLATGGWTASPGRGPFHAFVHDDGELRGYLLARYGTGGSPDRRTLYVVELIAEDTAVYEALLAWIAAQQDAWPMTRYEARPEDRLVDRLIEPRPPGSRGERRHWYPTAKLIRGPMLRVLQVEDALASRRWWDAGEPDDAFLFRLELDDLELPDNRGPWEVELRGEEVGVRPATGEADAVLTTDAATFGRIFAGDLPPSAAQRLGRASIGGDETRLDAAFATAERPWLLDEF